MSMRGQGLADRPAGGLCVFILIGEDRQLRKQTRLEKLRAAFVPTSRIAPKAPYTAVC